MKQDIRIYGLKIGETFVSRGDLDEGELTINYKYFGIFKYTVQKKATLLEVVVDGQKKVSVPIDKCSPIPANGDWYEYNGESILGYTTIHSGRVVNVKYNYKHSSLNSRIVVTLYIET